MWYNSAMELFSAAMYRGKRVCAALSGGVDSVCLLHAFKAQAADMGITLSAIHIEHGIRGEESLRDMRFCEALCAAWDIPLKVVRENVPELAKREGGNLEQTARNVRYAAFRALLERGEADLVATAHHADDAAETVLFRLARGTGLGGMRAITEYGGIVRPLLKRTRAEIEAYALEKNLPHVEDSTNGDETYARNYIRRTVLPAFEGIHAGAKEHLAEFAALAAEEDAFLESLAEREIVRAGDELRIPSGLPDVIFRRACLICLHERGDADCTRANVEEIAKLRTARSGKRVRFRDGAVFREGNALVFSREEAPCLLEFPFSPEGGDYTLPAPFLVREAGDKEQIFPDRTGRLFADPDAFPAGCVVRTRREGDMITPYHAPRKTLKKFLTDRKIASRLRGKLPVIAKGSEVYAVVGVEISDFVKVTERTARRIVIVPRDDRFGRL